MEALRDQTSVKGVDNKKDIIYRILYKYEKKLFILDDIIIYVH